MTFVLEQAEGGRAAALVCEAWCSTTGERYDVMGVDRHALIDDYCPFLALGGGPDRASAGTRAPAGLVPGPRLPIGVEEDHPYLSAQRTGGQDALGLG